MYQYTQNLRPNAPSLEILPPKKKHVIIPGWYAQHSIDPEAELEDVEFLGFDKGSVLGGSKAGPYANITNHLNRLDLIDCRFIIDIRRNGLSFFLRYEVVFFLIGLSNQ